MMPPARAADLSTADRNRMLIGIGVAVVVHALLAVFAVFSVPVEAAPIDPASLDRTEVKTFEQDIVLPKPKVVPPPTPPTPEPEPEPDPEPAPKPPPKETSKTAKEEKSGPAPTPKPRPKRKRKRGAKKKKAVSGPKAVVLSNTIEGGSVAVYGGEEDVLGDPGVAATPASTTPPPPAPKFTSPTGTGSGDAPEPTARLIMPKPLNQKITEAAKRYPADAPRLGKVIRITLSFVVQTNGRAKGISVVKRTSGAKKNGPFDKAAKKLARKLAFRPATLGGKPIEKRIRWVVTYRPN